MKKNILLFIVVIFACMISCQTDDDTGPLDTQDKFIGSWKITQEFDNGVEETIETCDLQDVLTVTEDQKFSGTSHSMENGICTLQETLTGTWENLGGNKYKINSEQETEEVIEAIITFSGNTMTIEIMDQSGDFMELRYEG